MTSDGELPDTGNEVVPADENSDDKKNQSRREVRSIIFHLLYAAESCEYEISLESIADNFHRGFGLPITQEDETFKTAQAIIAIKEELDKEYIPFLENWRFERVSTVTMLILRFAVWELLHTNTSPNIIINEAVELAKCFAEDDAYRFINGILDRVSKAHGKEVVEEID